MELAKVVTEGVNNLWILMVSFLIFFMQPGFAMLEAGQVRARNVVHVLIKNLCDWCLGVMIYFVIGLGIANFFGQVTSVEGYTGGVYNYINDPTAWIGWLFGAVFAMTAATITSGAVAGRIKFKAYLFYSVALTAIIYPFIQGITWGGGLLSASGYLGELIGAGYKDFAGATVVHMLGGIAGLAGAAVLGPRQGRFDENGQPNPIPGHNITIVVLGTFILAFGWYGFNVGTQASILSVSQLGEVSFQEPALARVALNTTLAMGAGAIFALITTIFTKGFPDVLFACNGLLAGLVGITGACAHVSVIGGLIIGMISGIQAPLVFRWVVNELGVDDVCGVFCVHGSAGAIGTWLIPFFDTAGFSMNQLIMQTVGILVIAVWTSLTITLVFKLADSVVGLRLPVEDEQRGMDQTEHNIIAYPYFVERNQMAE